MHVTREVFTADEARTYWDDRHATASSLGSGGSIGFAESLNALLYAVQTARIAEALDYAWDAYVPLHVLDAGCGRGVFSRELSKFGYRVDGIDTSKVGIEESTASAQPGDRFAVSALQDWQPGYLYDAVICINVLYHIMDDGEWEASVRNLASLVRLGGRIVIADHETPEEKLWSHYQKTRPPARYVELLKAAGFRTGRLIPYGFRDDPTCLHVATRVA